LFPLQFEHCWTFDLEATRQQLWPFVSNTDQFNRDMGLPVVDRTGPGPHGGQMLQTFMKGFIPAVWEECPFDWQAPERFSLTRCYQSGPMRRLDVEVKLLPGKDGGTHLVYHLCCEARNWFWAQLLGHDLKTFGKTMETVFRRYDLLAARDAVGPKETVRLTRGAQTRFDAAINRLADRGIRIDVCTAIRYAITTSPDVEVLHLRAYALADHWRISRREMLEAMLVATREGILDLRWEVLCPYCRGAKQRVESLREIATEVHCDGCNIDVAVNVDQFVEAIFQPSTGIRKISIGEFCLGSPQRTPHVLAQKQITASEYEIVRAPMNAGFYRVRILGSRGAQRVIVEPSGNASATVGLRNDTWGVDDVRVVTSGALRIENGSEADHVFILEHLAWGDTAATAADVTMLQVFRDVFSGEALRPGQQLALRNLTIVFTDLKGSTALYNTDAYGTFRAVMEHFDVLHKLIAKEGGTIVKNIGDAILAVFPRPLPALQAMLEAQRALAEGKSGSYRPLHLKVGIHHASTAIAATLPYNPGTIDYFGPPINLAARLEPLSNGANIVVSLLVIQDPEVEIFLAQNANLLEVQEFQALLKGFGSEEFTLYRIRAIQNKEDAALL